MKRSYAVYQVDAFTKEKLSGNPAGVVLDARGLTDEEMRRIARELNNSETAFILPGKPGEYDVQVRFFTPAKSAATPPSPLIMSGPWSWGWTAPGWSRSAERVFSR